MENKRNTKQKEKIIEYLKQNANKHLTIQQIKDSLNEEIGLTTIYRMINCLIKQGQVIKIPLDNKQGFCYQYNEKNENCTNHYHLICEKCGKLAHFESESFLDICREAKKKEEFSINNEKVVFYGLCKKCK